MFIIKIMMIIKIIVIVWYVCLEYDWFNRVLKKWYVIELIKIVV